MNNEPWRYIHLKDHEYSWSSLRFPTNLDSYFLNNTDVKYDITDKMKQLLGDIPYKFFRFGKTPMLEIYDSSNMRYIASKLGMKYVISNKSWRPSKEVFDSLSQFEGRYVITFSESFYIINIEDYEEAISLLMKFDGMELKESKIG